MLREIWICWKEHPVVARKDVSSDNTSMKGRFPTKRSFSVRGELFSEKSYDWLKFSDMFQGNNSFKG